MLPEGLSALRWRGASRCARRRTDAARGAGQHAAARQTGCAAAATEETDTMSKHPRGNREFKKPKKPPTPLSPDLPAATAPAALPGRLKRR
jgi:hypothetical protein